MIKYKKQKNYKRYRYFDICLNYIFFIGLFIFIYFLINRFNDEKIYIPIENISAFQISSKDMINLLNLSFEYELNFSEVLTLYSLENNFFEEKNYENENIEQSFLINYNDIKKKYIKRDFEKYYNLINGIVTEIKSFPIPNSESDKYTYNDSWGAERTYGGKREHKGTDIIDRENIEGNIPIISMTDGKIENIGWNEKGGYRVGVRSKNGNYYYYAHLNSFSEDIYIGMNIKSGQLLGYMGNTGYSKIEGTKGKFEVHLHMGIEITAPYISKDSFWINPYPFLNYIEEINKK